MRAVSDDFLAQMVGSRMGEIVEATVFRGGDVVAEKLAITSWEYSEHIDQQVKGAFSCIVADDTGELIPYQMADPLSPAGTTLVVDYVSAGGRMRLGEFTVTEAVPDVCLYIRGGRVVSKLGTVKLTCKDLTAELVADRLLAPESPPKNATIGSELERLSRGMPVTFLPGTTGTSKVPPSVVYEKERMNALDDLASRAGGFLRMGEDSSLQVVPTTPEDTPVWEITGGDTGTLISYSSKLKIDGVYNGVISSSGAGQDAKTQYVGKAFETDGPMRWGGPLGYRPLFHSSSLISSQLEADKDAKTRLENIVNRRYVELEVSCLPNPALQVGDVVALPILAEGSRIDTSDITGIITSLSLSGSDTGVEAGSLTVKVTSSAFKKALAFGVEE